MLSTLLIHCVFKGHPIVTEFQFGYKWVLRQVLLTETRHFFSRGINATLDFRGFGLVNKSWVRSPVKAIGDIRKSIQS